MKKEKEFLEDGRKALVKKIRALTPAVLIVSAWCCLLCTSCARSLSDEGWPDGYTHYSEMDNSSLLPVGANGSTGNIDKELLYYSRATDAELYDKCIDNHNENARIEALEYKIKANPAKREQYEQEIKKIKEGFNESRLDFLRKFYTSLYKMDGKKFTHRYVGRCSTNMSGALKYAYAKVHQGAKGYAWFLFGDNARHEEANFAYSHVNGDWYQVKLDTSKVYVMVTGVKDNMMISGLVNKHFNVGVK